MMAFWKLNKKMIKIFKMQIIRFHHLQWRGRGGCGAFLIKRESLFCNQWHTRAGKTNPFKVVINITVLSADAIGTSSHFGPSLMFNQASITNIRLRCTWLAVANALPYIKATADTTIPRIRMHSIKSLFYGTQHNQAQPSAIMLSVVMLTVMMLSFAMLNVIMLNVLVPWNNHIKFYGPNTWMWFKGRFLVVNYFVKLIVWWSSWMIPVV